MHSITYEPRPRSASAVRRAATSGASVGFAPPLVNDVLRSPGWALDEETRAFMEPRFGHSFADVRVHADGPAAESAAAVSAHAYAVGRDVVFGAGRYEPASAEGRRLLAHELAHVVQQSAAGTVAPQACLEVGAAGAPEERAAERAVSAVASGGSAALDGAGSTVRLRRQGAEDDVHAGMAERWRTEHGLSAEDDSSTGYTDAIVKYRMIGCAQPGSARDVTLQPVFFRTGPADASPTGGSWATRLAVAQTVWKKLGVTVAASTAITLDDAANKTAGGTRAERDRVRGLVSGAGVEAFMLDNDLADAGGGGTVGGGADGAKIALSDRGTSSTLLAHELGHVLGLNHPPGGADANTIMTPTGGHSVDNPVRNTLGNYRRITWPLPVLPTCIHPDP